jgi:hypothetical protein
MIALKAWHVLPCGLVLMFLAGLAVVAFAPRPLTATDVLQSAELRMPVAAGLRYEEAAPDPFVRQAELLADILREADRRK